jgi:hypothetical protein
MTIGALNRDDSNDNQPNPDFVVSIYFFLFFAKQIIIIEIIFFFL